MRLKNIFQTIAFIAILFSVPHALAVEKGHFEDYAVEMQGLLSPDYAINRDTSGTNWVQDSSPMHSLQLKLGQWDAMFHANILLRYTNQNTFEGAKRGDGDYSFGKNALFGRTELVEKPAEDLGIENNDEIFNVAAFSFGAARGIYHHNGFFASLGASATVNFVEDGLKPFYGDMPFSFQIFIKIAPSLMEMKGHGM